MSYQFKEQSNRIIKNIEEQAAEIKEVSRKIRRARKLLRDRPKRPGVVFKKVKQGTRGGLYYINKSGRRVYLNTGQCKRCVNGRYPGRAKTEDDKITNSALGCPPVRPVKCQPTKAELKREIKRLRKFIDEDC